MPISYFPDPLFAWAFLGVLGGLLAVAAYVDTRFLVLPKWLTLTALGLGLLANVVRGVWLGAAGRPTWAFGANGAAVGGLDGLSFALAGLLVGFGLYFTLWLLNVCGGGDVKIAAAMGAWVGPSLVLWVFAATVVAVAVLTFLLLLGRFLTGQSFRVATEVRTAAHPKKAGHVRPRRRAMGFALPLAVACLLVLPWFFRYDLGMAVPPAGPADAPTQNR